MGIKNVILGSFTAEVRVALNAPEARASVPWRSGTFGEAFNNGLLVSVDRSHGGSVLVPETPATAAALDPLATGWHRRAGDVLRNIVSYADATGRPIEGVGLGTTLNQFRAVRSTSALQEEATRRSITGADVKRIARFTNGGPGLYGTHERGRIFLTPRVTNVLLNQHPERVPRSVARTALHTIDHELGHVANARTPRPLSSGQEAEAIAELRTRLGNMRIAPLQRELGFHDQTTPNRTFYDTAVEWLRGLFHRTGATSDAAISAELARQPDDRLMYELLAARLLERNGIDPSFHEAAMQAIHAPNYPTTAATTLERLDKVIQATPRGVTYEQLQSSRRAHEAAST